MPSTPPKTCAAFCVSLFAAIMPCHAADTDASGQRFEVYTSADYDGRAASLSSAAVWSFWGPVGEVGPRIKLDGLVGGYGATNASVFSSNFMASDLQTLSGLTVGYQFNTGPLWIKLYAGAAYQAQIRAFLDAGSIVQQRALGPTAAVETYWRAGNRVWTSANISWLQPGNSVSLYSEAAYEVYRIDGGIDISAGAETAFAIGNANSFKEGKAIGRYNDYLRGGGLLNIRYGIHDFTLSGGVSGANTGEGCTPYATIRYGRKF